MKIMDYIKQLNSDVSNVANCEKAKKLRKNLLIGGGIALGGGFLLLIVAIILITSGMMTIGAIVPAMTIGGFVLCVVASFIISGGGVAVKLGLSIVIAGVSTKYLDKTFTKKCECGNIIKDEELFCSNCGKNVRPICSSCKAEQDVDAKFCRKCGSKLD